MQCIAPSLSLSLSLSPSFSRSLCLARALSLSLTHSLTHSLSLTHTHTLLTEKLFCSAFHQRTLSLSLSLSSDRSCSDLQANRELCGLHSFTRARGNVRPRGLGGCCCWCVCVCVYVCVTLSLSLFLSLPLPPSAPPFLFLSFPLVSLSVF